VNKRADRSPDGGSRSFNCSKPMINLAFRWGPIGPCFCHTLRMMNGERSQNMPIDIDTNPEGAVKGVVCVETAILSSPRHSEP